MAVLLVLAVLFVVLGLRNGRQEAGPLIDAGNRPVRVSDGDTLKIDGETIRIFGIDAVERSQFCRDAHGGAWSCGASAMAALEELVARGGLRCTGIDHDRYGRTVARCAVKGVEDVGGALVDQGWAVDLPDKSHGRYAAREAEARRLERGIWAGTFDKPWDWRKRNGVRTRTVPSDAPTLPN